MRISSTFRGDTELKERGLFQITSDLVTALKTELEPKTVVGIDMFKISVEMSPLPSDESQEFGTPAFVSYRLYDKSGAEVGPLQGGLLYLRNGKAAACLDRPLENGDRGDYRGDPAIVVSELTAAILNRLRRRAV